MAASIFASAALVVLSAFAPSWPTLLLARGLLGVSLSGVPAVAMTYLAEEMHPESIGVLGIASGVLFARFLPGSRHFAPHPPRLSGLVQRYRRPWRDPALPWLFAEGFLLLGGFVTVYNYLAYRLMAPPYGLSQSAVGMIFAVYLVGTLSSAWVGRRAGESRAQASSLYSFSYYLGSSVAGASGGFFYAAHGWRGVAGFIGALWFGGLLIAWRLARGSASAPDGSPAD